MAWRFVLANLAGRSLGEPVAFDRRLSVGVSRVGSAGFRIRDTDPMWPAIGAGEAMLKVFDPAGTLRFYGPVIADEETASGQGAMVHVAAAELTWRLGHRFYAPDPYGDGRGTVAWTATDAGTIASDVLAEANATEATGITLGTVGTFAQRTVQYLWANALQTITDLGAFEGSYEWALRYVDGTPPACHLDLVAKLGDDRTAAVFLDYGCGKHNVASYTRSRSIDTLANVVWATGDASATVPAEAEDDDSIALYRRHEDLVAVGDITDTAMLAALAAAHVAARAKPRTVITLTPHTKLAPRAGVDYWTGDVVTARAVVKGQTRYDGPARMWAIDVAIDEQGTETVTPQLTPDA